MAERPGPMHRFVPTLTEVVPHTDTSQPENVSVPSISREEFEILVEQMLRRAEKALGQHLPESLSILLHEQALAITEMMRKEIQLTVRKVILETLAERVQASRER